MIPKALIQVTSTRTVHCLTLTAVAAAELFWLAADRSRVCCKWLSAISLSFICFECIVVCEADLCPVLFITILTDTTHVSQAAELMMLQCNVSLVLTSRTPAHCLSKLPVSRARWQVASARQLTVSWPPPHVSCIRPAQAQPQTQEKDLSPCFHSELSQVQISSNATCRL